MPEEVQPVPPPVVHENKTSVLDKNVPNPLAKNPNFFTHKVFASVGIILLGTIIILAIVAYFYRDQVADFLNASKDSSAKSVTVTTKVSTSSAKKATSSALPAGWKTYTNTKLGFSIDYPVAKLCSKSSIVERAGTIDLKDAQNEVAFKAYDCLSDSSVLVAKMNPTYPEPTTMFGLWTFASEKNATIDNIKTKIKTYGADPGNIELVYLKKGNTIYLFQYSGSLISQNKQGDEITPTEFEQMLSSFKFL